ncbi:MAG TPA: long-chain fatty acid--CoA ligase [Anaeromyxobacter sp.]|nr:long-chain fatty acid--CoA ligase [Anaeromyxobacter sp.]
MLTSPTSSDVHRSPEALAAPALESPSLAALFEARAAAFGSRTAVLAKRDGAWHEHGWGELARRVRDVADGLAALGVEHGDRVAMLSQTRLEALVADLGTLATGAVAVPIYQTSTAREVEDALVRSGATWVFCEDEAQVRKVRDVRGRLPALRGLVVLEGTSGDGTELPLAALEALGRAHAHDHPGDHAERVGEIEPDDPACILWTSGTTGAPKGVVLTHGNWLHAAKAIGALDVVRPDDTVLLFLPLAHSFAKLCEFGWIQTGGRLAIAESVERLVENAGEVRPTVLPAPPRVYEKVFGAVVAKGASERGLRGFLFRAAMAAFDRWSAAQDADRRSGGVGLALARRVVFPKVARTLRERLGGRMRILASGSAPLSPRIGRFFDALGLPILEGYALTECSAAATANRPGRARYGTVGPPLPGMEVRIAEDGEVLVRGPCLMAGYWEDPDATAEAIPDGWLHTGDVGAVDPDGYLRITDRKKDVFKTSGGKMVAPQAIEKELKASEPLVSHVLVHGHARRFVSALVTLDAAAVARWAEAERLTLARPASKDPRVRERVQRAVDAVNGELPRFATIKRFAILPEDLSVAGGELTPTMKLRRRAVEEKYRGVLDALYAEDRPGRV